jgi:glutamate dehydrogenase
MLTLQTTNLKLDRFPEYSDPFELVIEPVIPAVMPTNGMDNKLVSRLQDEQESRQPSPQPTHVSVGAKINGNGQHRVLRSATMGYVAPTFAGKLDQRNQGRLRQRSWSVRHTNNIP